MDADGQQAPETAQDVLHMFRTPRPSRTQRYAQGEGIRQERPLQSLAQVPDQAQRSDPLQLLESQERTRQQSLIHLRHERMTADPFAFLRGAALIMADDLSKTPQSGISVQLCGDAHVANFGMFASPERDLVFDLNDFDETNPGPFEWDVKRLVASIVVAGRVGGHSDKKVRRAALAAAQSYREVMRALASMRTMDVWFAKLDFNDLMRAIQQTDLGRVAQKAGKKARKRTGDSAVAKLTEVVNGTRRFREDPPILVRVPEQDQETVIEELAQTYARYLRTLPLDRIALLMRHSFVDVAHKVVGVGSVGTLAIALLLESGDGEPLILQIKQAQQSVLEAYTQPSIFSDPGQRVVSGQQLMQATGDPFLGWSQTRAGERLDFYVRQLRDMKGSIETAEMTPEALRTYAQICGGVLARAHARAGSAPLISGYLGDTEDFEQAVADFGVAYAAINDSDHQRLLALT